MLPPYDTSSQVWHATAVKKVEFSATKSSIAHSHIQFRQRSRVSATKSSIAHSHIEFRQPSRVLRTLTSKFVQVEFSTSPVFYTSSFLQVEFRSDHHGACYINCCCWSMDRNSKLTYIYAIYLFIYLFIDWLICLFVYFFFKLKRKVWGFHVLNTVSVRFCRITNNLDTYLTVIRPTIGPEDVCNILNPCTLCTR